MSLISKQLFVQGEKSSKDKVKPPSAVKAQEFYDDVIKSPPKCVNKQSTQYKKLPKATRKPSVELTPPSQSSLLKASQEGDLENVLNCINSGVNLDCVDDYGWTPIMIGTVSGSISCVQALLSSGASTKIRSKAGETCYSLALKRGRKYIANIFESNPAIKEEKPAPTSTEEVSSKIIAPAYFCESCNVHVRDSSSHRASITHQLKTNQFSNIGTQYGLSESNKGFQMLLDKGWDRNEGLGTEERKGPKFPVKTVLKRDRTGIGFLPRNQVVARVTHFKPFDRRSVKDVNRRFRKRKKAGNDNKK